MDLIWRWCLSNTHPSRTTGLQRLRAKITVTGSRHVLHQQPRRAEKLRLIADGIVAIALRLSGKTAIVLDDAYSTLEGAFIQTFPADGATGDTTALDRIIEQGLIPTVPTDYSRWEPLHWIIEAPDVMLQHGGFDAIIGNPPFLGGKKITGSSGTNLRDWLVHGIARGARGSADLVAYFLLRAHDLLRATGQTGLIGTNTIGQGDTREVGLDQIVREGSIIRRSVQSMSWPSQGAALQVALLWTSKRPVESGVQAFADGLPVARISTLLEAEGRATGTPRRLAENKGKAFYGTIILGSGFLLTDQERAELLAQEPAAVDLIKPYLGGKDITARSDLTASRWAIDFEGRSLDQAENYPVSIDRVRRLVLPERAEVKRASYRDRWWQYAERVQGLYRAIASLEDIHVITSTSKVVMPVRVSAGQVFSSSLTIFATDQPGDLAVLSSTLHQTWAIKWGSTLETRSVYTPSDVYETFPFPDQTKRLRTAGRELETARGELMLTRKLGLTELYNLVNNPEVRADSGIDNLRATHMEVDAAALAAYGWDDLQLEHGFHSYRQMERFTMSPAARIEVLDRLLEENLLRAAAASRSATGQTGLF